MLHRGVPRGSPHDGGFPHDGGCSVDDTPPLAEYVAAELVEYIDFDFTTVTVDDFQDFERASTIGALVRMGTTPPVVVTRAEHKNCRALRRSNRDRELPERSTTRSSTTHRIAL